MKIAAERDFSEVLKILAEFTELSVQVKLLQLFNLMYSDDVENLKEEFQSILQSVPVDLVNSVNFLFLLHPISCVCCVELATFNNLPTERVQPVPDILPIYL